MPKASSKKPTSATKSNTGVNARASRQVERDRVRGAAELSMKQSEYQDLLFIVCGLLCNSAARQKAAAMLAKQHSQQMLHGLFQIIMAFTILNLLTLLGTKQDARYDPIDQVFGDLGYGYEEEPFFGDDDEDQEENQGVDVAENQEEESNIPQGDEQFFPHFQQEANDEEVRSEKFSEEDEGFDNTPTHGKRKQAETRGSGRRVKARMNEEVSFFFHSRCIPPTYLQRLSSVHFQKMCSQPMVSVHDLERSNLVTLQIGGLPNWQKLATVQCAITLPLRKPSLFPSPRKNFPGLVLLKEQKGRMK